MRRPRKYGPGIPLPDGEHGECEHCERVIITCSPTCSCRVIVGRDVYSWQHLDQWHACDPTADDGTTAEPR